MEHSKMEKPPIPVLGGTGGAVPVKNEKGEMTMQKVKVIRYVAGKRPTYAPTSDNEEEMSADSQESDDEDVRVSSGNRANVVHVRTNDADDRRLRRLMEVDKDESRGERAIRHRQVAEPEVLEENEDDEDEDEASDLKREESENEDDEVDEEERARRRLELKKNALKRQEELMAVEEDHKESGSDDDSKSDDSDDDDDDDDDDDEEDEMAPRLKPIFVRKSDRVTIQEKEKELEKETQIKLERARLHQETKKETRKMIEKAAKESLAEKETDENVKCDFETDDENGETDYEAWKLRELKRMKRDRDEKEAQEREKHEIQRIRNMTEEERLAYLLANPKVLVNQASKGKYKFLQKYYHRGAFFMNEDDEVYKRNFAQPTLEDHFDKTILPKVMQVKNFGMSGRTKYTHLLDQDTTRSEDNPWSNQDKFIVGKGGGTKETFEKPSAKRK
jgi:microfibrillar-associated protein 1